MKLVTIPNFHRPLFQIVHIQVFTWFRTRTFMANIKCVKVRALLVKSAVHYGPLKSAYMVNLKFTRSDLANPEPGQDRTKEKATLKSSASDGCRLQDY